SPDMKKIRTDEMLDTLHNTANISDFLKKHEVHFVQQDFARCLAAFTEKKGLVREHVIRRADIDRTYGHQIYEGRRRPSRDKVIQLAFGLELDESEVRELLIAAGYMPLYPKISRDAILIFCIVHKKSINDANHLLDREGLSLLGKG
ncbi:MAG: helix-turn-helix domain-containing protein, partial [Clostridia bacterium]|nr:helix-turn-helix domain-containing protein [Clostridia bacterium]